MKLNNIFKNLVSKLNEFKIKNSNDLLLVVLSLISLIMTHKHIGLKMLVGVLVVGVIGFSFTRNIVYSIAIAMITINILVLLNLSGYVNIEYYQNSDSSGNVLDSSGNIIKTDEVKKDEVKTDEVKKENEKKEGADDELNVRESFLEAYKSLTPDQVNGLNTDTKQLIQTQQQLLETLKNMGPALQEGQTILNTFKQYFGSDGDLEKGINDLKNMK